MKKSACVFTVICFLLFIAGTAFAQGFPSAKFAATWNTDPGIESVINIDWTNTDAGGTAWVLPDEGYTLATIKVPNNKELLVGVSAEIGIVTDTSVKGKLGGEAKAVAGGRAYVNVFAIPKDGGPSIPAAPGQITLSQRVQELSATLGGVIKSCDVNCYYEPLADCDLVDPTPGDPDSGDEFYQCDIICDDIVIADDCVVNYEQIGLLLDTTAAHHYNFVFPDLPVGTYDIKAVFTTGVRAQVDICDEGDECVLAYDPDGDVFGRAAAKAIINNNMVTVQEVRAVKDEFLEID